DHVITLRARAETPEDASRFLEGVAHEILDAHRASFAAAVAVLEARLESLEIQRQAFESQIALIQEEMERVREVNPVQASVLAVESGKLMAQLPELEGRRAEVELNLLEARSYPTALLRAPTVAIKPVQPRPALYAALGLMLGL